MILLFSFIYGSRSVLSDRLKTAHFVSRPHLTTFFFDDIKNQVKILSHHKTYFFISTPTPERLSYYTDYATNDKSRVRFNKEEKILNENEFFKINDSGSSKTIFELNSKTMTGNQKKSGKTSSVSFLSFENEDECQNGIEFISSKADLEKAKRMPNKCFYLPPTDCKPAILFTYDHTYESSLMKRSQAMNFAQMRINKNHISRKMVNEENKVDLKSLYKSKSKTKTFNNKGTETIIGFLQSRTYLDSQNTIKNTYKNSQPISYSTKILATIGTFFVFLCMITFLVSLCTGKQSVEPSDSLDPYQNNTPTAQNAQYPLNAVQSDLSCLRNGVYMDPNAYYPNVVPYQGAKPFDRQMKDNIADGIKNVDFRPY